MATVSIVFCCAGSLGLSVTYVLLGKDGGSKKALAAKSFASLFFLAAGCVTAFYGNPSRYDLFILLGLFFGAVADVVIGVRFIVKRRAGRWFVAGALLFSIGHIFYIAAFNIIKRVSFGWYISALAFAFIVFELGIRAFKMHYGKLRFVILFYCLIVSVMLFSAIDVSSVFHHAKRLPLIFAAALFTFSDLVLMYTTFVKKRTLLHFLNIIPYYAGQLLFALSMLLY